MGNRGLARTAVVEVSREQVQEVPNRSSGPPPDELGAELAPAYAAALLKVVVELRRPEPRALEDTLDRILAGTPVDREEFRAYLQRNFSLLRRG
jgi:hypothetical protein